MYTYALCTGTFPSIWKLQRLVLLDKGRRPPITEHCAYWTLPRKADTKEASQQHRVKQRLHRKRGWFPERPIDDQCYQESHKKKHNKSLESRNVGRKERLQ